MVKKLEKKLRQKKLSGAITKVDEDDIFYTILSYIPD